ncbi:MAG: hypothetical protein ACJ74Z_19575 [Bryobacteraceae bacterium]
MALQLKRAGIQQVRPLAGGFEAWRDLGFPLEATSEIAAAHQD